MRNLFNETPEAISIKIMREYEPPEGYYLAFSGGKDSVVLYELARRAGVKFDPHYCVTGIDPPELVSFIHRQYPSVQRGGTMHWEKPPKMNWWRGLTKKGLPTRTVRWCCEMLKEHGGQGRVVLTGVRAAESRNRQKYGVVQPCRRRGQDKTFVHAMLHWQTGHVWAFIKGQGLPYCCLYDKGWKRLGCVLCPFEMHPQRAMARWPRLFEATRKRVVALYPQRPAWQARFASGEAFWQWWLSRDQPYPKAHDEQETFVFDQFDDEEDAA